MDSKLLSPIKTKLIQDLFEEQVALRPDKIAINFDGQTITYRELNERANCLAGKLIEHGLGREDIIGLVFNHSIDAVVVLLAILKAGGAYLPINPEYPEERIRYIAEDSKLRLLVAATDYTTQLNSILSSLNIQIVSLNSLENKDSPNFYTIRDKFVVSQEDNTQLAYVMYTSGSTGRPKGVMIGHRGVVRLVKHTNYFEFNENEKLLQTGALEFDASTFEIWGVLLNGATLYVTEKENLLTPSKLKEKLHSEGITTIWMTAPLFNQMVAEDIDIFSKLKTLLVGGDVLSCQHINSLKSRFKSLRVINGYGPTENTTFSTTLVIDKLYEKNIPIGKPISYTSAYILDSNLQEVNGAEVGELYLGGDGLAIGYLNNHVLTNQKFVTLLNKKGKFYRTGDLACFLPDGNIEFHGRIDDQVKIRGYRIELKEIDSVLQSLDEVKESYSTVYENQPLGKYICTYLVLSLNVDLEDVKQKLRSKITSYMIPDHFIILDKFPLNFNGKIDKAKLPIPSYSTCPVKDIKNDLERNITKIWSEILNISEQAISLDSTFFDLGGNSITVGIFISRLSKKYNVNLRFSDIFELKTVRNISALVKDSKKHNFANISKLDVRQYFSVKL